MALGSLDTLTISVNGDVQLNRRLSRITERFEDGEPLWENLTSYLAGVEKRQFNSDGRASSGGWQALAATTILQKQAEGMPHPTRPLHGFGDLEKSLTRTSPGAGALRIIESAFMIFGTQIEYAKYHQGDQSRSHIPLRRFLELTEGQRKTVSKRAQRFFITGMVLT